MNQITHPYLNSVLFLTIYNVTHLSLGEKYKTIVRLKGLELFIQLTLIDGIIAIRTYQVKLLKSGLDQPRIELESIGPGEPLPNIDSVTQK